MPTKSMPSGALERGNRWPGACETCQTYVGAWQGVISLDKIGRRWRVYCKAHDPRHHAPEPAPQPSPPPVEPARHDAPPADSGPAEQPATIDIDSVREAARDEARRVMRDELPEPADTGPLEIVVRQADKPAVKLDGPFHPALPQLIEALAARCHVYMVGPAGCGKTTLAEQAAKALGLAFKFTGAVGSPFELTGYRDAQGNYQSTQWREAVEHGGLFLFDEIDASDARAMLRFNAALANGRADFPDGAVDVHSELRVIAAANTFGNGADRQYVGRNQLDAATLDRFVTIALDYDETLERSLGEPAWTAYVQRVRAVARDLKLRHVVSTRAVLNGTRLLTAGWSVARVAEAVLWRGLDSDSRAKVEHAAPLPRERAA